MPSIPVIVRVVAVAHGRPEQAGNRVVVRNSERKKVEGEQRGSYSDLSPGQAAVGALLGKDSVPVPSLSESPVMMTH